MSKEFEILKTLVEEHWEEMRHIEDQRATSTNMILVVEAAILGFIAQKGFGVGSLILSILLIFIGIYGIFFASKLYERHQLFQSRLNLIYKRLDEILVTPEYFLCETRQGINMFWTTK